MAKEIVSEDVSIRFTFGKNWQNFLKCLDKDRFRNAELSLAEFLELDTLKGRTFLDVGCGSGLFSYAAFNLGAERIVSFDIDPFSVECCKYLRERAGIPENWAVYEGDILDSSFIANLGKFDIVYAWGVLHHTGKMWQAIKNSAVLVNGGGELYMAIYNKVEGRGGSDTWEKRKKFYNSSPRIVKRALEILFVLKFFYGKIVFFQNPITFIKNYKASRGMDWWTDVVDWLGGYPYEFATVNEVFKFMKANFPDFTLTNLTPGSTSGNNQFLFKRNET